MSSSDGQTINDYSPSTGEVVCTFPASSKTDVENAVKAANGALFSWSTVSKVLPNIWIIYILQWIEKPVMLRDIACY